MALVTTKDMFAKALTSDYAIGAFNVNNMEIIQGIVEAAKLEQSPLILQVSAGARKYAKPAYLLKLVEAAILDTGLDIALHLDHGEDFDICKKCVDDGFTSVMIDGSKHEFEENIRITKEVVEYAHAHGVVVEAELGKLAGVEDNIKVGLHNATRESLLAAVTHTFGYAKREREAHEKALELLDFFGMADLADAPAGSLPYGAQRRLEIVRALATGPKIILLDEPAAGMNPSETAELMTNIRRIRDTFQIAVMLIEHDMKLVMSICEGICVLDHGRIIAKGSPEQIVSDQKVVEAYLGKKKEGGDPA